MQKKNSGNALGYCNLCNNDIFEIVANRLRDSDDYKIYKCMSCSHVQLLPRPFVSEDKEYYDGNRQDRAIHKVINIKELKKSSISDVNRRADFIENRFSKNIDILDVGVGYGFFLEEMTNRGYKIKGVEISDERRDIAKTIIDVPILDINFCEESSGTESVDVVTLFHVLEHITDPIQFCKNLRNIIKKDSYLIVEVPNIDELLLQTCPEYNEFYWIRAHLNYFNAAILTDVLKRAGFRNIEMNFVQRYGVENLSNWLMTGKPQLESPRFNINDSYKWLEDHYRNYLEENGLSDTLFAIASV